MWQQAVLILLLNILCLYVGKTKTKEVCLLLTTTEDFLDGINSTIKPEIVGPVIEYFLMKIVSTFFTSSKFVHFHYYI